jgi:hypothetical protein
MRQFKERWKVRLEQVELWMVSYRIEVEYAAREQKQGGT